MQKPRLKPTVNQTFIIVPNPGDRSGDYDFAAILDASRKLEQSGEVERACDMRYQAFQRLVELLPDDGEIELEWEDRTTQHALMLIESSSIDHFLVGDFEMCAAMLEMLLELDSEDHLGVVTRLAYAYIALEEYELYDEIEGDIGDRTADKLILKLWSDVRRNGALDKGALGRLKSRYAEVYDEFVADTHPADESYIADIESERPSRRALARELWLQTEHLWREFPELVEALRASRK